MRKFLFAIILFQTFPLWAQNPNQITRVFTNFNGFWDSQNTAGVAPNNLHSMLGFEWKGQRYSTGVNDALLSSSVTGTFSAQKFQAFPPVSLPTPNSGTYIGVGSNYGGADANVQPIPVNNYLIQYITDGINGLGFGTAIYNFPAASEIKYEITPGIVPTSIGDGIPDIIVTQVGQVGNANDSFRFTNSSNTVIGNSVDINFQTSVIPIGFPKYKFYNPNTTPPTYVSSLYGTRELRVLALDWSEFGITASNYTSVKYVIQKFSGFSDIAFTAYNTKSVAILQSISGVVFNDNDAGTPDGSPYPNATVNLYSGSNTTTPLFTTTTANNGAYVFPYLGAGNYVVEVIKPAGFQNVSETDGFPDSKLNVTLGDFALINQNFGINQPPVANNDTGSGEKNSPISINISANDTDPNSGAVVPSTINLIPPTGATSITTDSFGRVKSFTVINVGTWSVNNSGVLTFTPVLGFTGSPTNIQYTINDPAGLTSNIATVSFTVLAYCTKTPTTLTGGNPSKFGISTQAVKLQTWPEAIPNGHIVLESTKKGFVITRVQNSSVITDAKEGMIIYDIDASCVKLFNGSTWKCIARDCNQ